MQRILASSGIMWEGDDKRFIALIHDSSEEGESGFCATCAEIPKAVGQGETVEDCLKDLRACIQFIPFGSDTPKLASALRRMVNSYS